MASPGYNPSDATIIAVAREIYNSSHMNEIRKAHKKGVPLAVTIGKYKVQYEALPFSGCTAVNADGFLIGTEALASEAELKKTLLHELHRLHNSNSSNGRGVDRDTEKAQTEAAFQFAERFCNSI